MSSHISIAHAIEAKNWAEVIFGTEDVGLMNQFMRAVDDGYNIQERWFLDPDRSGRANIPLMREDLSARGHGLRVGSLAAVFSRSGHRENSLMLFALYSGPQPGDLLS